jgi:hypothetical protein
MDQSIPDIRVSGMPVLGGQDRIDFEKSFMESLAKQAKLHDWPNQFYLHLVANPGDTTTTYAFLRHADKRLHYEICRKLNGHSLNVGGKQLFANYRVMDRVSAPKYRVDELLAALTMENITLQNIISQLSHDQNETVDGFVEEPEWIGAGKNLIEL